MNPSPVIRQLADAEQVSRAAADEFTTLARQAVAARGRFTVAHAGGSTPRGLYQLLAEKPWRDQVDWPKVEFFWGDERPVPADHADSNYRMANEALLQKRSLSPTRIHRLQADRTDRDDAARDYQAEIARVFGVPAEGEPPPFDLVLLGMGPDGHTATLFPYTSALTERTRWVVPNSVPKFSAERLTLTASILNRAAQVLFLVAGADKAVPLAEVLEGPPDATGLPSQLIHPAAGRCVWFLGRLAAGRLTRIPPQEPPA
jgi:6-phosphogluconolactonase